MAETLTQSQEVVWLRPSHLAYITREIKRHQEAARNYRWMTDGGEVERAGRAKVYEIGKRMHDPYLRCGIAGLYRNWAEFGDYLLTPKAIREPIDGDWIDFQWDGITACVGATCLAARMAESDITVVFNTVTLAATPDTLPADMQANYWEELHPK